MNNYNLQVNEGLLYSSDLVSYKKAGGELLLTTLNLVFSGKQSAGIFTTEEVVFKFPLNLINVVNNRAQVFVKAKGVEVSRELEVHCLNGIEKFIFRNNKEPIVIANLINKELTGIEENIYDTGGNAIENIIGTGKDFASGVFGSIGAIAAGVGAKKGESFNEKKFSNEPLKENLVGKCTSCGAPLSGISGDIIYCKYCDSAQRL